MSALVARAQRPQAWVWKSLLALTVAIGAVAVGDRLVRAPPSASPPAPALDSATLVPDFGATTFAEALDEANGKVALWQVRLAEHPDDWVFQEGLAGALSARYRLSGDYADLAQADALLARGMAGAPWPAGPVLNRAATSLSIHRLDDAAAALDRFAAWATPPSAGEAADAGSMRCEIALQRGQLRAAETQCARASDATTRLRQANIAMKAGRANDAARIVEDVLRRPGWSPQALATIALQRASIALESGDWPAAGRWVRAADRLFPGFWLTQTYLAQQAALEGDMREALRRYRAVADRTGNPEVIDAYVEMLEAQRGGEEARAWTERADTAWRRRFALLPEAAAGHYASHLAIAGHADRALALAAADYRRRPTASGAETYAAALTRIGRVDDALHVLRDTRSRGWKTAAMLAQEAALLQTLGRVDDADKAWADARKIDPRITDPARRFVRFYQH